MKNLNLFLLLPLLFSFTPLVQDGSVNNDSNLMQERIEKAHQNRLEQAEALRLIREEKKEQKQEEEAFEGSIEQRMNEAEKLVK